MCSVIKPDYETMQLTDNEKLQLSEMRSSFAAADATLAVGEFTEGIKDLLESGYPKGIYRALAGIEKVKSAFQRRAIPFLP